MMTKHLSGISAISQAWFRWKNAWSIPNFRRSLMIALSILGLVGYFLSDFFAFIQDRPGIILKDPILKWLPPYDLSIPILMCIYTPLLYLLYQAVKYPSVLWKFVSGFVILHLLRIISMLLIPLETPEDFIAPYDPMQELFYGGKIISKDLFFSGHTAMVFWIFFSVRQGVIKKIMLLTNLALMVMLLIQHIHYTIDIVVALIVTIALQGLFWKIEILLLGDQMWFEHD
ncbi:MAG: phosphatase PAP2 family protein [Saprospiraceae bacterium]|nr:phosphatase PAP2 family protein [Saprospiraceae bacterium]